jgi:hypothetical protein
MNITVENALGYRSNLVIHFFKLTLTIKIEA